MNATDRDDPMGGADMHLGPGLDRMFPVRLPGGRLASVRSLSMWPTNWGILEGGLNASANEHQQAQWITQVRERHGDPLHVVAPVVTKVPHHGPTRERLPWIACAARLVSAPIDPEMTNSLLTLVWWQDPSDTPLREWIERAAEGLDWNAAARDWSFF